MRHHPRGGASPRAPAQSLATLAALLSAAPHAHAQCEQTWDDRFTTPDIGFPLHSIVATTHNQTPAVFAAGWLDGGPGRRDAGGLIEWNGSTWDPAPGGLTAMWPNNARLTGGGAAGRPVYAWSYQSSARFSVDDEPLGAAAEWDGAAWRSLDLPPGVTLLSPGPEGFPPRPALLRRDGDSSEIAVLSDGQWTSIASDDYPTGVRTLFWAVFGNGPRLFALGWFDELAGKPISYAAAWDGTAWSAVGSGPPIPIDSATLVDTRSGPRIVALGDDVILEYDGHEWRTTPFDDAADAAEILGPWGAPGAEAALLCSLTYHPPSTCLWSWDGTHMERLPGEFDGEVISAAAAPAPDDAEFYLAGTFMHVGEQVSVAVAAFDGQRWLPRANTHAGGGAQAGTPVVLAVGDEGGPLLGNRVFVGGNVARAWLGGNEAVVAWNGATWESLGFTLPDDYQTVTAMLLANLGDGPRLVVAGDMIWNEHNLGDIVAWDGREWSNIGGEFELVGTPVALAVWDDGSGPMLYAAGGLRIYGDGIDTPASIARFNRDHWEVFLSPDSGGVSHMAVFDDGTGPTLYACNNGGFDFGQGAIGPVIKWTPTRWEEVGQTLYYYNLGIADAQALAPIEVDGRRLLTIRGLFELEDSDWNANHQIAVLDGGQWRPDIEYLPHHAFFLHSVETDHGLVTLLDNFTDPQVTVIDRDGWRTLPGTFNSGFWGMTVSDVDGPDSVYVAGWFDRIDDLPSDGFARFGCSRCLADFDADGDTDASDFTLFLSLWSEADPATDLDDSGDIDTRDLIDFLNLWNAGC